MFNNIKYILIAMRPAQWTKNVFIFAGLFFSKSIFNPTSLLKVSTGFILFSLAASSIYIFNDILDVEYDKQHPEKSKRPLAAGLIGISMAYFTAAVLAITSIILAFLLNQTFFIILATYVMMNIAYSLKIKHVVILDVMCIAFGFVFRMLAGTALVGVRPTDWLILCTITISLFLGFSKRRNELSLIGDTADSHRKVLLHYSLPFLDQMIAICTACTVMSYALYTVSAETVSRLGSRNLVFTIPFVLYGIYRYLYLIYLKERGGNPTSTLFSDFPLILSYILWAFAAFIIIY